MVNRMSYIAILTLSIIREIHIKSVDFSGLHSGLYKNIYIHGTPHRFWS